MCIRYFKRVRMSNPNHTPVNGVPVVPCSLYRDFDSVAEAEAFACSRTPVNNPNEMRGILAVFKNTLLKHLGAQKQQK